MKQKVEYITYENGVSELLTRINIENDTPINESVSYTTEDELSIQHSINESLAQEQSVSGGTQ